MQIPLELTEEVDLLFNNMQGLGFPFICASSACVVKEKVCAAVGMCRVSPCQQGWA